MLQKSSLALLTVAVASWMTAFHVFQLHRQVGPARQPINVRWAAETSETDRRATETTLQLLNGEEREPGTWTYRLADHSYEAVRRIVSHPLVADTAYIDRERFQILINAPESPAWFRRLLQADLGPPLAALLSTIGLAAFWFARRELPLVVRRVLAARTEGLSGAATAALLAVAFILTVGIRFLSTTGFNNDHFVHLSAAQQMLFGDWPTRDFIDIGRPLTIVVSAAAQWFFGTNLLTEALVVAGAFGLATMLTCWALLDVTQRWWIALGAALLQVCAFPRSYSYPKVLTMALGAVLILRVIQRPTVARRLGLAAGIAVAFLFRHDLAVYVGVGGLVAAVLAEPDSETQTRIRHAAWLATTTLAFVAPYLVYVQLNAGLVDYIQTSLAASQAEAGRVWPNPFVWAATADTYLLYVFHALPLATIGIITYDAGRGRLGIDARFALAVSAMALLANFSLMRDLLAARVPDAIVPAALLTGWLTHRILQFHSRTFTTVLAAALVGLTVLVFELGNVGEQLNRAGLGPSTLTSPAALADRFAARSAALQERFDSHVPAGVVGGLSGFLAYLDRCTPNDTRLFLGGMIPEVAYYARRPFGGGGYEHYNFRSATNQELVVKRMRNQDVPYALIPTETQSEFEERLPIVAAYIRSRYRILTTVSTGARTDVVILIDSDAPWRTIDAETGWPCLR